MAKLGDRANWLDRLQRAGFPATERNWRRYVSNYLGALRMIDDQVKRMADYMVKAGLLKNPIIVRVSDCGDYLLDYGRARKGVGLPEALTHIPMFWHGLGIKLHPAGDPPRSCLWQT